ncbi:MAG: shikimate dehydrogenase [Candidatus Melainabacteria bacterium]|nr:shikimate dehydrogenase [Candidatus Melainabacteria bacterium]
MLKLGIIGYPLEHSLSPVMHTAALQYLNINGHYRAYEVSENELKGIFEQLKGSGMKGFNVTIPHKINIIPLLDELTETAKLVGAVNTVTFKENGKSIGDNTDAMGFWEAIPENLRKIIPGKSVSILGCGGSAKAIVAALLLNDTKHIKVYGRDEEKLTNFKNFLDSRIEIDLLKNIDLSKTSMLVNTTPVGMHPKTNNSLISIQELKKLPADAIVYDIIYNPSETKLLKDARSLNLKTINGIEMLIRQGAYSLRIWLEQDIAPLGAMRLAVLQSLK